MDDRLVHLQPGWGVNGPLKIADFLRRIVVAPNYMPIWRGDATQPIVVRGVCSALPLEVRCGRPVPLDNAADRLEA
jgi:hypothetical protein